MYDVMLCMGCVIIIIEETTTKKIPAALRFFAPRRIAVHIIHTDLAFIESTIFKIINHKDYLVTH